MPDLQRGRLMPRLQATLKRYLGTTVPGNRLSDRI
jgi:hypothetical protein